MGRSREEGGRRRAARLTSTRRLRTLTATMQADGPVSCTACSPTSSWGRWALHTSARCSRPLRSSAGSRRARRERSRSGRLGRTSPAGSLLCGLGSASRSMHRPAGTVRGPPAPPSPRLWGLKNNINSQ